MDDEFIFEDEDGNEFVFEDEDDKKKSNLKTSTSYLSYSTPSTPSSFSSGNSFSSSSNSKLSSYSKHSSFDNSNDDDSSSEEWIFEEASDDETNKPLPQLKRNVTEPVFKSKPFTRSTSPSVHSKAKFSSSLTSDDFKSSPKPNSDLKKMAWVKDEDLIDLPDTQKPKPQKSIINRNISNSARSRSESDTSRNIRNTPPIPTKPSSLFTNNEETKNENEQDIADQITALRIISSKGKDTKYLSIRGAPPAPPPQTSSPFCGAVSNDPRTNIVSEIVTTEEAYISDLEILIRLFLVPLSSSKNKKKKPILTKVQIKDLFSNVESILNLNRVLLTDLQKQASLPPQEQRIGASFNLLAKCLLIYTDYCSNQKKADELYSKLKSSNDKFNALLDENIKKPECRSLDLNAFLIKPVQRACKYPLLLRELLKQTPESHVDYNDLKQAFEAMQESCLKLNERKRDVENMSHFLTIKARTGKNFIETGRTFVDDGHIKMITEKVNKRTSKIRFRLRKGRYVLFSDMVVFIAEGKVVAQILLNTAQVKDPKLTAHPLAILLLTRASKLFLLPNSQVEKDSIMKLISEQIEELEKRKSSRDFQKQKSRLGKKRDTNSASFECILNGNTKKHVEIPPTCKHIRDLKRRLQTAFSLPNQNFKITFETGGTLVGITTNQELSQYLPFVKQIHIIV